MKSGPSYNKAITIISGGVGGAKLARGFVLAFPERRINIIANTADDTEFHGLYVSPDQDSLMYALAGLSSQERGWGIKDDSFHCLSQLAEYGEAAWFKLGDRDMATQILRTKLLREGKTLTQVTSHLSRKLGIHANILPMTNQRVRTFIKTDKGNLPFQEYFVLKQKEVRIKDISFKGIGKCRPTEEVADAIGQAEMIVFAPSNPVVSVLPVLSVSGMKGLLKKSTALKLAVSPFVGKKAVSGPAKELIEAKGFEGSSTGLARFYSGIIDIIFIHPSDEGEKEKIEKEEMAVVTAETIMKDADDSIFLARKIYQTFTQQRGLMP